MEVLNLKQLYELNKEFHNYVDKYAISRGITVETAITHKLVESVAKMYLSNN